MNKLNYNDVLSTINEWIIQSKASWINEGVVVEISGYDAISIDLDFKNCLAKIVVENAVFAPYRYVSFESLAIPNNDEKHTYDLNLIYTWYDDENTDVNTIISELNKGIAFCHSYNR